MTVREVYAFGTNGNVEMTKEEYQALTSEWDTSDVKAYIEKVDNYIQTTGREYPNHATTVRQWLEKDNVHRKWKEPARGQGENSDRENAANMVYQYDSITEGNIYKTMRRLYHINHCVCGTRLEFIDFTSPEVDGVIPNAKYKCPKCSKYAYETFRNGIEKQPLEFSVEERPDIIENSKRV